MTISELICEILAQYSKVFGVGIPKTKLLKLAYLVEVKYKRRYMKRLTEAKWVYYLYGPYLWDYDEILQCKDININYREYKNNKDKEIEIISLQDCYHNENISSEYKFFINSIIRDYGNMDLVDLLDYVYFETEPMINAENRREDLNFDCILPEDYYYVKEIKLDPKIEKNIRRELRNKAEAFRGKRST